MPSIAPQSQCGLKVMGFKNILAVTCDFQQCGILTSVDSDEHVQPHVKLRMSK